MKKICLILTLALVLVGAFSAVALAANPNPLVTTPTVDRTHSPVSPGTVNAHTGFTVTGDTCANCHSMHYAGNGFNLTVQTSVTNESMPCLACHDGTTGNYDVIAGVIGDDTTLASGGLFANYTTDVKTTKQNNAMPKLNSGSMHDVFGGVEAYIGAPGGRGATTDVVVANGKETPSYDLGTWVEGELNCGSCHSVHSAINPRLLSVNPNGIMDDKSVKDEVAGTSNGNAADKFYFAQAPGSGISVKVNGKSAVYVRDYQVLWETVDSLANLVNDAGESLYSDDRGAYPGYNSKFKVDKAYVVITNTALTGEVKLSYKPAFQVQMKITDKNTAAEKIQYGMGMENFCTACHTDFKGSKTKEIDNGDGTTTEVSNLGHFNQLAHHTGDRSNKSQPILGNYVAGVTWTTNDPVGPAGDTGNMDQGSIGSCLTCHYAHGVNKDRWATTSQALGYKNAAGTGLYNIDETDGSSANKRVPNTAMCVLCHGVVQTNGSGQSDK